MRKTLEASTGRVSTGEARTHAVWSAASHRGFTLIELLVVTLLMGIVITAIGACLGAGLRVWDATQHFGTAESDGLVAMEVICRDLRNTFPIQAIPFQGAETAITMAGLVKDQELEQTGMGSIRYSLDSARRVLLRESWIHADHDERIRRESLVGGIVDLRFVIHPPPDTTSRFVTNLIPPQVDVTLSVQAAADGPVVELTRSVHLAAGEAP